MVETRPPLPRQFVAFNWLSLVGCLWAEPASVWPVDSILVDGSIIVKFLFLMKLTPTWFWKLLVGCWSTDFVRLRLTAPAAMHIRPLRGRKRKLRARPALPSFAIMEKMAGTARAARLEKRDCRVGLRPPRNDSGGRVGGRWIGYRGSGYRVFSCLRDC